MKKGALFKANQPKGDVGGKPKRACFNCNEVGHYSKDCPKSKSGKCNRLIFLKGKISKWDVLCLLDIGASHNFITRESVKRMELQLEEFKAPIEVHFADGVLHPTTL